MTDDRRFPGWVRYSGVGLELAGATAGLALVGYWIDGKFGTSPWGILGGVIDRHRRRSVQPDQGIAGRGSRRQKRRRRQERLAGTYGSSAIAVAVVVALAAIGSCPRGVSPGEAASPAMFAGCAIGLISAALAGLLLVDAGGDAGSADAAQLPGDVVRLAIVVALGAAAALSGCFRRRRCCSGWRSPTWRCCRSK